jgi:hypothetical protein
MSSFTGYHSTHENVTCINYAGGYETDQIKFEDKL